MAILKKIWIAIDGKKTFTGLIITLAGTLMFNFEFTEKAAPFVLSAGLGTLGFGGGHKIIKYRKENEKNQNFYHRTIN